MINSFKQYLVEESKIIYFTFGRMNPPTIGHEKLLESLAKKSGRNPYRVYLSQSQDTKKNPLPVMEKTKAVRKMFPKHARSVIYDKTVRSVFDVAVKLFNEGFKKVIMVVGSDRVREFDVLLNKYNGQKGRHGLYNFENIMVESAGQRDPDAEGAEGMSASKMRKAASDNDFRSFSQGLPRNMSNSNAKSLYNAVREGMGLKAQKEFKNHIELNKVSVLREKFVKEHIFQPGDKVIVKETNERGQILIRGSNYLILDINGVKKRKWLDDVKENVTKSFKSMMDSVNMQKANRRIDREKEMDKKKHTAMRNQARLRDVMAKNKNSRRAANV